MAKVHFLNFANSLETVHETEEANGVWIETSPNGDGVISIQLDNKRSIRVSQTRQELERIHKILQERLNGFE